MPRTKPRLWRRPGRPSGRARPGPAEPLPVGRIYLRVGEVALERGKRNMRGMAQATGLAYTTVHALVRHPDQSEAISFDVLARLSAYLACGPADLLGYGPPGDYAVGTDGDQDEEYERPTPPPRDVQWRHLGPDEEAPEPEEDEEYLLPEQWRQLHPDSVLDIKAHPASLAHEEHRRVLHPGPT